MFKEVVFDDLRRNPNLFRLTEIERSSVMQQFFIQRYELKLQDKESLIHGFLGIGFATLLSAALGRPGKPEHVRESGNWQKSRTFEKTVKVKEKSGNVLKF